MSNIVAADSQAAAIEKVLISGDLAKLSPEERVSYYNRVCEGLGLNPLTKPFDYITLNGKLTLYARKDATDQLRRIYKISISIVSRDSMGDTYIVTARATDPSGRTDESTGALSVKGLKDEAMANALMKAETKAKRRVTLSICGLGMLDEVEVESIRDAKPYLSEPAVQTVLEAVMRPVERPVKPLKEPEDPGDHVIRVGKKYVGMKIRDVSQHELMGFISWIYTKAAESFRQAEDTQEFLFYAENYLNAIKAKEFDNELDLRLSSDNS